MCAVRVVTSSNMRGKIYFTRIREWRLSLYTSAFDNGITIVRGMEVHVARGGYTSFPPTIGYSEYGAI